MDKILKGGTPAELPIEEPTIRADHNLKTAKQIGLTIPSRVLARGGQGNQMHRSQSSDVRGQQDSGLGSLPGEFGLSRKDRDREIMIEKDR